MERIGLMTEAQKRAKQNYNKKISRFYMEFTEKEKDLRDYLFSQHNKAGYIKSLIRQDMQK